MREIMASLVSQPKWNVPIPPVPRIHEWLIDQKRLSRRKLRKALQDYDIVRDGTIAQYLLGKGIISQEVLDEAMAARAKLIEKRREELQKDLVSA